MEHERQPSSHDCEREFCACSREGVMRGGSWVEDGGGAEQGLSSGVIGLRAMPLPLEKSI